MKNLLRAILILVGAGLLAGGCGTEAYYDFEEDRPLTVSSTSGTSVSTSAEETAESEAEAIAIWVYVCGAVHKPGVYELPQGSRVFEAIALAGGLTDEADPRALNQAAMLTDGEQITVLTEEEAETQGALPGQMAVAESTKVNLNTATQEQLMTLSGIGEARAKAILAFREAHGPFTTIEEIMLVEGIKEKSFEKIKEDIEV